MKSRKIHWPSSVAALLGQGLFCVPYVLEESSAGEDGASLGFIPADPADPRLKVLPSADGSSPSIFWIFVLLWCFFCVFAVLGSGSGLKMLLEVIRSILAEYQPVISILDPFQASF